ncbi:PREDICTED: uncharacterized protein LOC104789258 [Camelina sativa]|uniref:Uncharacterized protein LOC104789258 n=1 Tax=Camelina sativa TaxID=90675 RepID=A0ABM0ZBJ5_CAMSA|nr:PREDICTED: uncharacterized protein LOC104789258 [Camelina sativa]
MEMKETTKTEDKPEMKIRRKITSLDDDELWAGFEWEETDRIMSGEIKPKTLITAYAIRIRGQLWLHRRCAQYEIVIINLLNGASASFRVYDLIERASIPNRVAPPSGRYPHLHVRGFDSLASVGTARMIHSLFPNVSHSGGPFRTRSNACFCSEEALAGESSSSPTKIKFKECGPRFALELLAVSRASLDTGEFDLICAGKSPLN